MRVVCIPLFILLVLISNGFSSPIPGDLVIDPFGDHKPEDEAILQEANHEANDQYIHMLRVLDHPEDANHKRIITKSFGPEPKLGEIRQNVELLISKKLQVGNVRRPEGSDPGVLGYMLPADKTVHFTHEFYSDLSKKGRAGTVIHEATHALFGSKDYFTKETGPGGIQPISQADAEHVPHHVGYLHADFDMLKNKASGVMHKNADSYLAFGHYAKYGPDAEIKHERPDVPPRRPESGKKAPPPVPPRRPVSGEKTSPPVPPRRPVSSEKTPPPVPQRKPASGEKIPLPVGHPASVVKTHLPVPPERPASREKPSSHIPGQPANDKKTLPPVPSRHAVIGEKTPILVPHQNSGNSMKAPPPQIHSGSSLAPSRGITKTKKSSLSGSTVQDTSNRRFQQGFSKHPEGRAKRPSVTKGIAALKRPGVPKQPMNVVKPPSNAKGTPSKVPRKLRNAGRPKKVVKNRTNSVKRPSAASKQKSHSRQK